VLNNINILKSTPFSEIISSEKVLILLSTYSTLYLGGRNPGGCEKCLINYYNEILRTGMEKHEQYQKIKARTLVPNWAGVKYIRGAFYDSETITDDVALSAIALGYLNESHFKKMPKTNAKQFDPLPEVTEQNAEEIKASNPASNPKRKNKKRR
jgi:hypothetical protein